MSTDGHALTDQLEVCAPRATVFSFLTESELFARWWGKGSSIAARDKGAVRIRYPNEATASGEVEAVEDQQGITFTFGYDDDDKPLAPGSSRVTLRLSDIGESGLFPGGTRVEILHEKLPSAEVADAHRPGWRYQLSLLAKEASDEAHRDVERIVGRWLDAWNVSDEEQRLRHLSAATTEDVRFRDPFGCVSSREQLAAHIAAARAQMPLTLAADGEVQHVQGAAMFRWVALDDKEEVRARGVNTLELTPEGRIRSLVGFWGS